MRKRFALILIFIINIAIAVLIGWYMYKINNIPDADNEQLSYESNIKIQDECTEFAKAISVQVNSEEEKISPGSKLVVQKYYKDCMHITKDYVELPKELVNMTKKELEEYYRNWSVKDFSKDSVTLYKEFKGICNEHYILKEHDGYVAIYSVDEENIENYLKSTGIATQYLSQKDLENLANGIIVFGNDRLYQALEDFE